MLMTKENWFYYFVWVVGVLALTQSGVIQLSAFWTLTLVSIPVAWSCSKNERWIEKIMWVVSGMVLTIPLFLFFKWRETANLWIQMLYVILGTLTLRRMKDEE